MQIGGALRGREQRVQKQARACVHVCACVRACVRVCACVHVSACVCMCVHMCVSCACVGTS